MGETLALWNRVREVPATAKKPIEAGRLKGKTDINPIWRLKTLTDEFGPCGIGWKYVVTKREFVPGNAGEVAVFVDIDLQYRTAEGWSEPVHGIGGRMFVVKEKNGLYTDDEAPKKAETDAISVAAKSLGVAADVYWDKDATKYTPRPEQEQKAVKDNTTSTGTPLPPADRTGLITQEQVKQILILLPDRQRQRNMLEAYNLRSLSDMDGELAAKVIRKLERERDEMQGQTA